MKNFKEGDNVFFEFTKVDGTVVKMHGEILSLERSGMYLVKSRNGTIKPFHPNALHLAHESATLSSAKTPDKENN